MSRAGRALCIYKSDLAKIEAGGGEISIFDKPQNFIGKAFHSDSSEMSLRIFTTKMKKSIKSSRAKRFLPPKMEKWDFSKRRCQETENVKTEDQRPAFVKSRAALKFAARGYKEINLRALKLLNKNGILAVPRCSFYFSEVCF